MVTPSNDKVLCVCSPSGNTWIGGVSSKDYIIIWEIKIKEIKKKILRDFNCVMVKRDGDGGKEIKTL